MLAHNNFLKHNFSRLWKFITFWDLLLYSTLNTVEEVVTTASAAKCRNHYLRQLALLATLCVKHALNSVNWESILKVLRHKFKILQYLLCVVNDYLRRDSCYITIQVSMIEICHCESCTAVDSGTRLSPMMVPCVRRC